MITVGATLIVITLVILIVLFLCCKLRGKPNQQNNDEKLRYSDDDLSVMFESTSKLWFYFFIIFFSCLRYRNIKFRIDVGRKVMDRLIVAITSRILNKVLLNQIIRLHRRIVPKALLILKSDVEVAFLLLDRWIFLLATGIVQFNQFNIPINSQTP